MAGVCGTGSRDFAYKSAESTEYSVPESEQDTARHRATVLRREQGRQRLERLFGWRLSAAYQRLRVYYRRWRHLFSFRFVPSWGLKEDPYASWVREEARLLEAKPGSTQPLTPEAQLPVSIFTTVHDPSLPWLEESVASVLVQFHSGWELWLCGVNLSPAARAVVERLQDRDPRIKVVASPTFADEATALNHALGRASGEFIGLLGQHDTLAPHALSEVLHFARNYQADVLYTDEDTLDEAGRRSAPFCKPDWSPDLCLSSFYACHFGVYRKRLIEEIGGFRSIDRESLAYDLLLRCMEPSERIVHVPRILYHTRRIAQSSLGLAHASAKQAVQDALQRRGDLATVEDGPAPCTFHVRRRVRGSPLVSIIIPTRDRLTLLRRCLESIETRTTYRNYEILLIDNGSQEPRTLSYLAGLPHRVIRDDGPFNFARLNNRAATMARGEHLLLLNNDVEVITPKWLEALLEHSQRQEVGAVGAQLLYADGTIQHAGVVLGVRGVAGHAHKYLSAKEAGYFFFPHLIRNYSAVTAACLMIRKSLYEEVGGMEERLGVTFNDVDLCLRLRARGYLVVYTPHARLYHHESRSRWYQPPRAEEVQYMLERWGALLANDPYYNPHLTLTEEDFRFDLGRARQLL
jgi:GT2 family glycosyltransferase